MAAEALSITSTRGRRATQRRKIVWQPTPARHGQLSSQSMFLISGQVRTLVREVLFHGSRGNGKSESLLMSFAQHVGKGWGVYWKGVILRLEFSSLKDIIEKSHILFPKLFPGAVYNISTRIWKFPTGESLLFDYIKKKEQYDAKFHGQEYSYIGFDELTTWQTDEIYESMQSCLRTSYQPTKTQPNMPPLQVRSTTNPWGIGKRWVKERFIDGKKSGEIEYIDGVRARLAIFGTVFENPFIDEAYKNWLKSIRDPNKRASWLLGDWNARDDGSIFGSVWNPDILILNPFTIPSHWKADRSFDYGQSTPFCGLWHAEANGESVTLPDGSVFCPPKGSIIVVGEDYGTPVDDRGNQKKADEGLYLSPGKIGARLKARELKLQETILKNHKHVTPGPADNQIFNGSKVDKGSAPTVAKELEKEGVKYTNSDKSPGSRVTSAQLMYDRLQNTVDQESGKPHIYFFSNCKFLIKCLPDLLRDPDNLDAVNKGPDDHAWDALAYRLTWKRPSGSVQQGIR